MSRAPYQMEFNGLLFGLGTTIGVESVSGFDDFTMDMADVPVPRNWGDIPGLHTAQSKEVTIELTMGDDTDLALVLATFQPSAEPLPLYFNWPGLGDRFLYARVIGRARPVNPVAKFKKMVTVRLKAADPRIYAAAEQNGTLTPYNPSGGGTDYNKDGNTDYPGDPTAGEITAQNNGTTSTYPLILIYGPQDAGTMTGATVQNISTGAQADFDFITPMGASDIFTVDMRRIVTADAGDAPYIALGAVNRYGDWQLPRTPFALEPGVNVLRFEVDGTTTDASAVVRWRDASL